MRKTQPILLGKGGQIFCRMLYLCSIAVLLQGCSSNTQPLSQNDTTPSPNPTRAETSFIPASSAPQPTATPEEYSPPQLNSARDIFEWLSTEGHYQYGTSSVDYVNKVFYRITMPGEYYRNLYAFNKNTVLEKRNDALTIINSDGTVINTDFIMDNYYSDYQDRCFSADNRFFAVSFGNDDKPFQVEQTAVFELATGKITYYNASNCCSFMNNSIVAIAKDGNILTDLVTGKKLINRDVYRYFIGKRGIAYIDNEEDAAYYLDMDSGKTTKLLDSNDNNPYAIADWDFVKTNDDSVIGICDDKYLSIYYEETSKLITYDMDLPVFRMKHSRKEEIGLVCLNGKIYVGPVNPVYDDERMSEALFYEIEPGTSNYTLINFKLVG